MPASVANAVRGEASFSGYKLRPSFTNLVSAEAELGPLFGLVERAAAGELALVEVTALLWHCIEGERPSREDFGEAVAAAGLAAVTPAVRAVLSQILHGQ